MKTNMLSAIAFLFLAFTLTSDAVQVQEGNLSFSLEAVKQLQELIDSKAAEQQSPGMRTSTDVSVCADPALPEEFLPLCQQKGASMSLSRLGMVPMDVCEICAFAACTGC